MIAEKRVYKSKKREMLLCIFLGYYGAHKFYRRKYLIGILYMFSAGLFLIGWIRDITILNRERKVLKKEYLKVKEPFKWSSVKKNAFLNAKKFIDESFNIPPKEIETLQEQNLELTSQVKKQSEHLIGLENNIQEKEGLAINREMIMNIELKNLELSEMINEQNLKIDSLTNALNIERKLVEENVSELNKLSNEKAEMMNKYQKLINQKDNEIDKLRQELSDKQINPNDLVMNSYGRNENESVSMNLDIKLADDLEVSENAKRAISLLGKSGINKKEFKKQLVKENKMVDIYVGEINAEFEEDNDLELIIKQGDYYIINEEIYE